MMWKKRPDLLALIVYLVLAAADVALLYFMAYVPEEIAYIAGWPAWYLVCTVGGGIVFLLAGALIIFRCYGEEDFKVEQEEAKK